MCFSTGLASGFLIMCGVLSTGFVVAVGLVVGFTSGLLAGLATTGASSAHFEPSQCLPLPHVCLAGVVLLHLPFEGIGDPSGHARAAGFGHTLLAGIADPSGHFWLTAAGHSVPAGTLVPSRHVI